MLTAKRKQEIETLANNILDKYEIHECPAKQLHDIMERENIKFFQNSFDDDNFDGLITKNNDGQFCIYINTLINYAPRHNFTIAHELGHYFLKHELKEGRLICDRNNVSEDNSIENELVEQEANYFAACLLMPREMFLNSYFKIMKNLNRSNYDRMYVDNQPCNYSDWKKMFYYFYYDFRISIMALKYRLLSFNLVEFNWDTETWNNTVREYINNSYSKS